MAGGNLRRNLLRSFLTISGVVVGIGAIVFLVSLGFGLQELATSKVANLDALTMLTVNPSQKEGAILDDTAVEKFKKIEGVESVSPLLSSPAQISKSGQEGGSDTVLNGVIPSSLAFEDLTVDFGNKTFSGDDAKEVIISVASLKNLNLTDPNKALNQTLTFDIVKVDANGNQTNDKTENKLDLKIIGISKEENTKFGYIPLNLLKKYDDKTYNSVKIKIKKREGMDTVRKAVDGMGFPTTSVKDTVDQINGIFNIIKGVLGGFGLIALFVAAIGIFNTLTISLLERTHEIGIMKAIGGRDRDVARIFTMEASLIGLLGGLIGVGIGWFLGLLINALVNFVATSVGGQASKLFSTPWWFALAVVGFAFCVSTFAGIWPARRAAKLDPLEALRYE
jgi:putative ABC transport system permease protein